MSEHRPLFRWAESLGTGRMSGAIDPIWRDRPIKSQSNTVRGGLYRQPDSRETSASSGAKAKSLGTGQMSEYRLPHFERVASTDGGEFSI
jgi:hypothetical protein